MTILTKSTFNILLLATMFLTTCVHSQDHKKTSILAPQNKWELSKRSNQIGDWTIIYFKSGNKRSGRLGKDTSSQTVTLIDSRDEGAYNLYEVSYITDDTGQVLWP